MLHYVCAEAMNSDGVNSMPSHSTYPAISTRGGTETNEELFKDMDVIQTILKCRPEFMWFVCKC